MKNYTYLFFSTSKCGKIGWKPNMKYLSLKILRIHQTGHGFLGWSQLLSMIGLSSSLELYTLPSLIHQVFGPYSPSFGPKTFKTKKKKGSFKAESWHAIIAMCCVHNNNWSTVQLVRDGGYVVCFWSKGGLRGWLELGIYIRPNLTGESVDIWQWHDQFMAM